MKIVINFIKHLTSRVKIRNLLKVKREICIELGAGSKEGKGNWITIDIEKGCDIFWDLRNGFPFPDASISKIYSSHLFEHLTFKEAQKLLTECRRVLIPGGKFLICVPNARIYIEAYFKSEPLDQETYFGHKPAFNNTTKIDYINYMAYMDGHHKYMFDEENILKVLLVNGFNNARLREFDSNLDLQERHFESVYAEAVK